MKRFTYFVIIFFVSLFTSCTPNLVEDNENTENTEEVYYVKYASNGLQGTYNASYTTEKGTSVGLTNIKGEDFERTIGPVSKGFVASFHIMSTLNYTTIAVRIEVKKGNDPFIVKKEAVHTSSGSAAYCGVSYTIE